MLPKVIHYCWFGESDMPENYKRLIAEWEAVHPDWVIKRWDESNAPMSLPYIKKAIENNNWANVSNYVRLYALKQEGGIYMDTDMKVLQPLDRLLSHQCFLGFESGNNGSPDFWVNNAIMGAVANHPFVVACDDYLLQNFDGTEQANLSSPHLATTVLKTQFGLKEYGRQLLDDIMLYEKEVFYPIPVDKAYLLKEVITYPEETIAVHLWGRTWFTNDMLIEEMDNLRRYSHELKDLVDRTANDLRRSQTDLEQATSRLTEVQQENTGLKELIKDSIGKIEGSQSALEKHAVETDRKMNELIDQLKEINEQQARMSEHQIRMNEQQIKMSEQQEQLKQLCGKKEAEREGLWSIAKRKLFKFK
jgi:hypothetical protein